MDNIKYTDILGNVMAYILWVLFAIQLKSDPSVHHSVARTTQLKYSL